MVSSDFVATPNGCGGSDVQRTVSDLLNPFDDKFDGCCRAHDSCFGLCAISDFKAGFNKCNSDFKQCMKSQCNKVKDFFKKQACNVAYKSIYTGVDIKG